MKTSNTLLPFSFTLANYRGGRVVLHKSYQEIISKTEYPESIRNILGQALAALALMSSNLKFKGKMSLQLQGDSRLSLLFVEINDRGHLRGLAQWQDDINMDDDFESLSKNSHLVVNIIPEKGKSYQGVVALDENTLAGCLNNYFKQSEQLLTGFWLFADESSASGLMLQAFPDANDSDLLMWDELSLLANTISANEMLELDHQTLLHRVFAEHDLNLFEPRKLQFHCPCSEEKALHSILLLSREEIDDIFQQQDTISSHCDFCNCEYTFNQEQIYQGLMQATESNDTRH